MKALLVDYGGESGAKDAALCVCRAYAKILELAGWHTSITQAPTLRAKADLVVLIPRLQIGGEVSDSSRRAVWNYLAESAKTPYCVVLPPDNPKHASQPVREATLLASLDVTTPEDSTPLPGLAVFMMRDFVVEVLSGQLIDRLHRGHLNSWVQSVAQHTGNQIAAVEFLANLTQVASRCDAGIWLSDHGVGSKPFQANSIDIFRGWCNALKEMRGETPTEEHIKVAVLDDQPVLLQDLLLPNWLWKYSRIKFEFKEARQLQACVDTCSRIKNRNQNQADVFLLDMDWRHAEDNDKKVCFTFDEALIKNAGTDFLAELGTGRGGNLFSLGKYLLELIVRYNEQYRHGTFHEVAEVLDDNYTDVNKRAEVLANWRKEYITANNQGVVVYHYLKAFDEKLPTVVFTAAHEDNVKLRQTAGHNTEFLSKAALMKRPDRLLTALRTVYNGRLRNSLDYLLAAKLCRTLLAWREDNVSNVKVDDDKMVAKTKTRVMAMLEFKVNKTVENYPGRNFELSQPAGSMCAERSAIAAAMAANPTLGKADKKTLYDEFKRIAVMGDPENKKRKNPCPSCGVCSEWIEKLTKMDTIMFSRCLKHFCFYPKNDRISY